MIPDLRDVDPRELRPPPSRQPYNGATRATRIAKRNPVATIRAEVVGGWHWSSTTSVIISNSTLVEYDQCHPPATTRLIIAQSLYFVGYFLLVFPIVAGTFRTKEIRQT